MSKTIHATKQERETHQLLTETVGLEDLDIVKSERCPKEKIARFVLCSSLGSGRLS